MKKSAFVLIALLFLVSLTYAGKVKKDVIYLKNGSVVNGFIISLVPSGQVKIRTKDNSLWVFEPSEIDSISRAGNFRGQIHTGYFNLTEAGISAGNSDNNYKAPFSLINISGWQLKNRFSVGAGAGIEFLSETYFPVVADFRYNLKRQGVNPFFGIQGGYSFAVDKADIQYVYSYSNIWPGPVGNNVKMKARGGLLLNPSVGICTSLNENLAFSFSAGYKIMRHRYSTEDDYKIDIDYNRLTIKVGLIFQ
jgi:hypothetical protein